MPRSNAVEGTSKQKQEKERKHKLQAENTGREQEAGGFRLSSSAL